MSDRMDDLSASIKHMVDEAIAKGEYITIRAAARSLTAKQTEIRDALPAGMRLDPAKNGTLSDSRIVYGEPTVIADSTVDPNPPDQSVLDQESFQDVDGEVAGEETAPAEGKEPKEKKVKEVLEPTVLCVVCNNHVRRDTIVRRGICPLCFRTLAKNAGVNSTKLEAMSDEEFEVILGTELGKRRSLEEYKVSRTLTKEQFDAFDPKLIPVKELFAAGREAGYGPGRVAQAVGGDRFRHEPVGGFGSVWTPYFYGARNAWYFNPEILNHFDDLKKPEKPVVEKKTRSAKDPTASRTGARGAKMTPVSTAPAEQSQDDENTGEGTPADADTARMSSTPA